MTTAFPMAAFTYQNGTLCADAVPLAEIAAEMGTPCLVYALAQVRADHAAVMRLAGPLAGGLRVSVRACPNRALLRFLAGLGLGADIAAAGDLDRALAAGFVPARLVFSGPHKRRDDVRAALLAGVRAFHVESVRELLMISACAQETAATADLWLCVNLDAAFGRLSMAAGDAGRAKAGMGLDVLGEAAALSSTCPAVVFRGLACHNSGVGAGGGFGRLADMVRLFRAQGYRVDALDLCADAPGPADPEAPRRAVETLAAAASAAARDLAGLGCDLSWNLGGILTDDAGILLTEVIAMKPSVLGDVVFLDAGPADVGSVGCDAGRLLPVRAVQKDEGQTTMIVAGPSADPADLWAACCPLPASTTVGDLVAILHAGSSQGGWGAVACGRALVPEMVVDGVRTAQVRRRVAVSEQLSWEMDPAWDERHG